MTYVIAEIGVNANASLAKAFELIKVAKDAGCNAVKFQKRTPDLCTPADQRDIMRDTPWGRMSYIEYRHHVEFGVEEYDAIERQCDRYNIDWFASVWDTDSVDFMVKYQPPYLKIPSAKLANHGLLEHAGMTGIPIMVSTGMSTSTEIEDAIDYLQGITSDIVIMHCTSTYPCPNNELNLNMIKTLKQTYTYPVGYSGHELGLQASIAAVALGAEYLERHITLDRSMWGTDQAASLEPTGLNRLVRDIRVIDEAMGDGVKKVYDSELPARKKLRGY